MFVCIEDHLVSKESNMEKLTMLLRDFWFLLLQFTSISIEYQNRRNFSLVNKVKNHDFLLFSIFRLTYVDLHYMYKSEM